ncbi:thioredoxin domain-containing protein [Candidatus Kaiserbacteria bacterium]|nr:thioredoxin domain-containing protein [Candidatus Kaiserbacteria bacterium]
MEENTTEQNDYQYAQEDMEVDGDKKNYTIPVAIIIAGALIAGALYFTNKESGPLDQVVEKLSGVPAVNASDHIIGNPNAKVVIVEYSDFECPFCKDFHGVLQQIIDEYGAQGDVAWVYRHFPIAQLHSKAAKEAEATECAAELGGNQGFWDYADRLFEVTPSNNGLDLSQLPIIAAEVGLDPVAFKTCLNSGRHADKVQAQYDEVVAAGGRGTPHNIVIVGDQQAPIEGAQPIEAMRRVVETLLNDSGNETVPVVPTQ